MITCIVLNSVIIDSTAVASLSHAILCPFASVQVEMLNQEDTCI
jgi:hypothetical protein